MPRIFTPPLAALEPRSEVTEARTLGYAAMDFARDDLGIDLHPWQCWLLVHMLELLPSGSLRFRTVVVLVARQNGKTTLSVVLALFFMYMLGRRLVIGTAQDLDVAEEIWQSAVDLVTELDDDERPVRPELNDLVADVVLTNGKKALELTTREKYKVKATSRGAGRSLSADLLMLDELREHQTWAAWAALTKTTLARSFALILCLSNAGNAKSVVLNKLRLVAHLALGNPDGLEAPTVDDEMADVLDEYDDDLFIAEWSPAPGCAINDREAWTYSNPSLGSPVKTDNVITEKAIANALRTDEEDDFRAEVLCQWPGDDRSRPVSVQRWGELGDAKWPAPDPAARRYAVEVSEDRLRASIVAAGPTGGRYLVWAEGADVGTSWIVPKLKELKAERGLRRVAIAKSSPALSLAPKIREAGIEVDEMSATAEAAACGQLVDAVRDGELVHLNDPLFLYALVSAVPRPIGNGGWGWQRRGAGDITPLSGGTLALDVAMRMATKAAWGSGATDDEAKGRDNMTGNPFRSGRLRI